MLPDFGAESPFQGGLGLGMGLEKELSAEKSFFYQTFCKSVEIQGFLLSVLLKRPAIVHVPFPI